MTSAVETQMLRRQTAAWIQAEVALIELRRPVWEPTLAGGKQEAPTSPTILTEQSFRLAPFKQRLTEMVQNTQDGDVPDLDYVLVGAWNANVQPKDWFVHEGQEWEVMSVEPNRRSRTACHLAHRKAG